LATAPGAGSELPGHRQINGKFCSTDIVLWRLLALTFPAAEIAFFIPWRRGAAANQQSDLPAAAITFSQNRRRSNGSTTGALAAARLSGRTASAPAAIDLTRGTPLLIFVALTPARELAIQRRADRPAQLLEPDGWRCGCGPPSAFRFRGIVVRKFGATMELGRRPTMMMSGFAWSGRRRAHAKSAREAQILCAAGSRRSSTSFPVVAAALLSRARARATN
jgi:hypothetical protein